MEEVSVVQAIADNWVWTLMVCGAVLWIIFHTIELIVKAVVRERSRRDIAAYVAEGSLKIDDAERLLKPRAKSSE